MRKAAHRGRFKSLVVWSLDRLHRSMVRAIQAVLELDRLGVQVVSVREPWLDTTGPVRSLLVARIKVPFDDLTTGLIDGVAAHRTRIDELIQAHSHAWTLERMAGTDRNVLRIATFELIGRPDVPTAVVLSEAVGLAKRYGGDDSGRFVNGVMGAIARATRGGAAD